MPEWFSSLRRSKAPAGGTPVLELLVVEGDDAGQKFTVDAQRVAIARGTPRSGQPGAILLRDRSVSAQQATIHVEGDYAILAHETGATNPTLVNGEPITSQRLRDGDRIQMGRVVLEVRERQGLVLGSLGEASGDVPTAAARTMMIDDSTEIRPRVGPGYYLVVLSGAGDGGLQFPIRPPRVIIGRDPGSDVHIDVRAVSRSHAEIRFEGDQLVLLHLSSVNQTFINGVSVERQAEVVVGDEIRLADRVVLKLRRESDDARPATPAPSPQVDVQAEMQVEMHQTSLQVRMEEKLARDREIEEKYAVTGSFLDIDVVGSYSMKHASNRPEHIIVSFERWRAWVTDVVEEFSGMVLNSNGDELMCFFDSTPQSVRAASAILTRLDAFNETGNVLESPFRLRVGIHTGSSLIDRKRGVAYSAILDVAGHLQKDADVNGLLISEDTLRALPNGVPFEAAGRLEREDIATYRLTGRID